MVCRLRIGLFLFAATIATTAIAQSPASFIVPDRIESTAQVDALTNRSKSNSSTILEGNGQTLSIDYSSDSDLQIFLFYLQSNKSYNPTDTVTFSLPAGESAHANIDLTHSTGWHTGTRSYKLTMMSQKLDPAVSFTAVEFLPTSVATLITTPFKQLSLPEVFTPSSYHALHGYSFFGLSFATILGIVCVISTLIVIGIWRKRGMMIALIILTSGQLLYGLRFSVDELRFTSEHLGSWLHDHTYDEAGSTYQIADTIRALSLGRKATNVFVCRDGTDFKQKLLRYLTYGPPSYVHIQSTPKDAIYILVMDKKDWNYENGMLTCNDTQTHAKLIKKYADESQLFEIQ